MMDRSLELYLTLVEGERKKRIISKSLEHCYVENKINIYNSFALSEEFHSMDRNVPKMSELYIPYPFNFQYDLEVHIYLNWEKLQSREIDILNSKINESNNTAKINERIQCVKDQGFTGLSKLDHFYNACAIRWPISEDIQGNYSSYIVRNPWSDRILSSLSENRYTIIYGGSGQGKTNVCCAFGIVMWDHFIFSKRGARFTISTKDEFKLKSVSWNTISRLYNSKASKSFSSFACMGFEAGTSIRRQISKKGRTTTWDDQSCILGLLAGLNVNESIVRDKLTGNHGINFVFHLTDEAQASSSAPLEASTNMLQNVGKGMFAMSGNYNNDNDGLSRNINPIGGWKNEEREINEFSRNWKSVTQNGQISNVEHFNNDDSPAIVSDDPLKLKKWHFLPTQQKKEKTYPTQEARNSNAYHSLWVGFRRGENSESFLINSEMLMESGAKIAPINCSENEKINLLSFDSAPSLIDRNILLEAFVSNVDGLGNLCFTSLENIAKGIDVNKYYEQSGGAILRACKRLNIPKNGGILDHTSHLQHKEFLYSNGYDFFPLVYNESPASSFSHPKKTSDNRIEYPFRVAEKQKEEGRTTYYYNYEVANDNCAVGYWVLRELIKRGQIRGLNETLINGIQGNNGLEKEVCSRRCWDDGNGKLVLENKREFKKKKEGDMSSKNFSPDILDTIAQMAFLACKRFGLIPGCSIDIEKRNKNKNKNHNTLIDKSKKVWDFK